MDSYSLTEAEHFQTLDQTLVLQPPVGANLREAFEQMLDQALKHQYPAHPQFENDVRLTLPALRRTLETIEKTSEISDKRLLIESAQRKELRQIVNPLKLGEMLEDHFLLGHYWKTHFIKKEAEHGGPMTVAKMREWMEQPHPMGLPRELQNLLILTFAAQTSRSFFLHNTPVPVAIDQLNDNLELREQALPSQADWEVATRRAAYIFAVTSSPLMNAANVAKFVAEVTAAAKEHEKECTRLA